MRLLCIFGFHKWERFSKCNDIYDKCKHCGLIRQTYLGFLDIKMTDDLLKRLKSCADLKKIIKLIKE